MISAFICPYRADRQTAREIIGNENFLEVHVSTDLAICEQRDPKGLYKRARAGKIPEFTGVSAPYEAPLAADIAIDTDVQSVEQSVDILVNILLSKSV